MNNLLAVLKSSTAVTPPIKQDKVPDQRGISDLLQLAGRLTPQPPANQQTPRPTETRVAPEKPQAVPQSSSKQTLADLGFERLQQLERMLSAVESRLTPVQKGELARLRDVIPADKTSSAVATSSNNPLVLTPDMLTPVQQGELARAIIASRTFGATNSGGAPTSKPPVSLADGELLGQRQTLSSQSPGILDVIVSAGGGLSPTQPGTQPGATGGRPGRQLGDNTLAPPSDRAISAADGELQAKTTEQEFSGLFTAPADGSDLGDLLDNVLFGAKSTEPWAVALRNFNTITDSSQTKNKLAIVDAFGVGVAEGVGSGFYVAAEGVATLVANVEQFRLDNSIAGYQGDALRVVGVTNRLPAWLDQLIPSHVRADRTNQYTRQMANNIGAYFQTRSENRSLIGSDIKGFLSSKWNEIKDKHAEAAAKGSVAEARWWGEITGRAAFEIAQTVNTVGDLAKIGKVAGGFAALGLAEGAAYTGQKLKEISKVADDIFAFVRAATQDRAVGIASLDEIKALNANLEEARFRGPDSLGSTPEARSVYNKLVAANQALVKAESDLATPRPKGPEAGVPDPVTLNAHQTNVLNQLQNIGDDHLFPPNTLFNEADLARITRHTGNEFAVFRHPTNGNIRIVRGNAHGITLDPQLKANLISGGYKLDIHSQIGFSLQEARASYEDQKLLLDFDQTSSRIVNSNGDISTYDFATSQRNVIENITNTQNVTAANFYNTQVYTPNTEYIVTDTGVATSSGATQTVYRFVTDSRGDTVRITGRLERVTNRPATRAGATLQAAIGNEGVQAQNPGLTDRQRDVGFHLGADQFGFGVNRANVMPGNKVLNGNVGENAQGSWGYLENKLRTRLVNDPNTPIDFEIEVEREPGPRDSRPSHFIYRYQIGNGPEFATRFSNEIPIPGVTSESISEE